MKSDIKDLTEGSLWSGILFFSIPLILSNLLQILFNMSDIAVIGRFAGPAALGSVGSTTTLVMIFTGFLMGMGGGVNVLTARFFGQDHPEEIRSAVHTSFLICLGAGLLLLLLGESFCKGILLLLRTKEELLPGAVLYLRIYFLGMPALAVYNFGQAVFSAAGDTRKPLMFLLVSGIMNVLLNLFFVLVMGMDVAGVAIASILAQYVSAACIMTALVRVRGPHAFRISALKADPDKVRSVLNIGFPAGLQNMIFSVANLFVQFGVNSFSAVMVAGNAAAQNADGLAYDVMAAFYTACGSFMGQNYGAGKRARVLGSYRVSLIYSFGAGADPDGRAFPGDLHLRSRGGGERNVPPQDHGLFLRLLRLHGLHHCGIPGAGPRRRPHGHRPPGFLCVPGALGDDGLCVFSHYHVAVSSLHLLLGHHRRRGAGLFPEGLR